ncbi:MAG: hypothetical protein WCV85_02585 [Patescibacteria group bacterium]|jgi:hypothetical protein
MSEEKKLEFTVVGFASAISAQEALRRLKDLGYKILSVKEFQEFAKQMVTDGQEWPTVDLQARLEGTLVVSGETIEGDEEPYFLTLNSLGEWEKEKRGKQENLYRPYFACILPQSSKSE